MKYEPRPLPVPIASRPISLLAWELAELETARMAGELFAAALALIAAGFCGIAF